MQLAAQSRWDLDPQVKQGYHNLYRGKNLPAQKSQAWLDARAKTINASEIAGIIGIDPFQTRNDLIAKKAFPEEAPFVSNEYTSWGNKYEPVAIALYEHLYSCHIHQLGLLRHENPACRVGASVDGLIIEPGNVRLIEIKCPKARKPFNDNDNSVANKYIAAGLEATQFVKENYWDQTQLQMEVTGINQCDFFDNQIREVRYDPAKPKKFKRGKYCGVLLTSGEETNEQVRYPEPILGIFSEQLSWATQNVQPHERIVIWNIDHFYITRVKRDPSWFEAMLPEIDQIFTEIEEYKKTRKFRRNTNIFSKYD